MCAKTVEHGDRIEIHFRSTMVSDNSEIESTFDKEPVEIVMGKTQLLKGLNKTLIGMKEGEFRKVRYEPEDAYGLHDPSMIAVLNKDEFPPNSIPAVGWMMKIGDIPVTVKAQDAATVTLDGNHPLAGKPVDFEIEIIKIY